MNTSTNTNSSCVKIGIAWLGGITIFAWLPDMFFNWGYNYLSFLPFCFTPFVLLVCMLVLIVPFEKIIPESLKRFILNPVCGVALGVICVLLFWLFRTKIHCFPGDGCVGNVPVDTVLKLTDFIPSLPGKGRLDGWGMGPLAKVLMQFDSPRHFTGMTMHLVSQVYSVVCGAIYVALTLVFFRRSIGAVCAMLTFPCIFNFFGNHDCYAFPLCVAAVFAASVASCNAAGTEVGVSRLIVASVVWLIGMWAHPSFVFGGFSLIPPAVRLCNRLQRRVRIDDCHVQLLFCMILLISFCSSRHGKAFFEWPEGAIPPVFSLDTVTHLINVVILPATPLALAVFTSGGRKEFFKTGAIFFFMSVCFIPLGFTLGACDQFVYMLFSFFTMLPWLLWIVKNGLSYPACRLVLAANLFLLIPMVAVHSSERTVERAEALYPIDLCKHNREMSWQTHLGLLLGDNIIDSKAVKAATLRVFANGARHALPERFRGGNYLYHTAFLYHFGEFEKGRAQLYGMLRQDPGIVRYFIGTRPAFIYCNRKILWDDIEDYFKKNVPVSYNAVSNAIGSCRNKAMSEPFYLKRPAYAKSEY